jgi:hypothetical protein
MMFSLQNQKAKLVNLNLRAEMHGEDHKTAADLTIEVTVSNDTLSEFHPSLKSSIYHKGDAAQQELLKDEGHHPALRFPNLSMPLKWDSELNGYQAIVHYGIGGKSDVVLNECQVDGFRFDCKEGGSVAIKYRVIAHPSPEQVGVLSGLIQNEIDMSLLPPEEQPELQQAA